MTEHDIFLEALEIADPVQRMDYLNRACVGNPGLRRQVEALLAAHGRSGKFLDVPALKQIAAGIPGCETGEEQPGPNREIDLSFLQPSARPGSLGRLGHYEIEAVIGRGGYGIVLKGFDELLQRVVAVKVIAPELAATSPARKRFLREARAAAAIRHDNVVSVHAVEEQPIPFLVMEYIPGQTLQQKVDQTGPLDAREVVQIGQQIACGLAAAHAKGLIHRDIKPANILLEEPDGRVKITDLGLARTADDASVTQSGAITGTPLYMSPEQALSQPIDQRSDLFSLGSVMYVMCSGRPPFRAGNAVAVLLRVAQDQPRPIQEIIPEVPDWLAAIIAKLHAKNPAERFGSAKEVSDLLGRCLADLQRHGRMESLGDILPMPSHPPVATKPEAPAKEAAPDKVTASEERTSAIQRRRPRRRWVAAAAVLLALLGGLSLTEATGVTNVRGTVIRLFSPDGALVVEVDDPGVSVTIDGEEMVITGTGVREIRLRPGQYTVLASKDGKLVRQELITVTRNGRQVVRVSKEGQAVTENRTKTADPDRAAAEHLLSIGGSIKVCNKSGEHTIKAATDLPRGEIALTGVFWHGNKKVDTATLHCLHDCTKLTRLWLGGTNISDADLGFLSNCKELIELDLGGTKLSDAGVALLKDCKDLEWLSLAQTSVTDAGLTHLKGCTKLKYLFLQNTPISDAGLAGLAGCVNLIYLNVQNTKVTDAGLVHLRNWPTLKELNLVNLPITDEGAARLKECKQVSWVGLFGCRPFITDVGLRHLGECPNLTGLAVFSNLITDAGLVHLQPCQKLETLQLQGNRLTDAGLEHLKALKNLRMLSLHAADDLSYADGKFTAEGVKKLAAALPECKIVWAGGVIEPKNAAVQTSPVPAVIQKKSLQLGQQWAGELGEQKKQFAYRPDGMLGRFGECYYATIPITLKAGQDVSITATVTGKTRLVGIHCLDPKGKRTDKEMWTPVGEKTVTVTIDGANASGKYTVVIFSDKAGPYTLKPTSDSGRETGERGKKEIELKRGLVPLKKN